MNDTALQLQSVIKVCRRSRSIADAGRALFGASRSSSSTGLFGFRALARHGEADACNRRASPTRLSDYRPLRLPVASSARTADLRSNAPSPTPAEPCSA